MIAWKLMVPVSVLMCLVACRESELDKEIRIAREREKKWQEEMNSPAHKKKVYDDLQKSSGSDPKKSLRVP